MNPREFRTRRRRGNAPIVAAVVLFGILLSVGTTYFITTVGEERYYQQAEAQYLKNQQQTQQTSGSLNVEGTVLTGSTRLSFYINNTGTAVNIAAYWILNGSDASVLQYENSTTLPSKLPLALGQGQSALINTNITASSTGQSFIIRVVTTSGVVAVGAYPSGDLSTASLNSDIAAGLGSATISFNSFEWYSYISGPNSTDVSSQESIGGLGDYYYLCSGGVLCSPGTWKLDLNHPNPGPLVPEGQDYTSLPCCYGGNVCGVTVPLAFSVNVTNQDPQQSDLVINSQANMWFIESCDAGTPTSECGVTAPVYVFYIVNVNQTTGEIISNSTNSYTQINLPYGVTKTLFFAASKPIQTNDMQVMSLTSDDEIRPGQNYGFYGQFAIYLLLPGTRIPPVGIQLYGQNIPFESTIAGDNIGWYSETPNICTGDTPTVFELQVNDSVFSGKSIDQVTLNATGFSSLAATAPTGWSYGINNDQITWTNTNSSYLITPQSPTNSLNFTWVGLAPSLQYATQEIFPLSIYWNGGTLTKLQEAAACFVNANIQPPTPTKVPSGVLDYVPITLANLQTLPVTGGTQVMLDVNWSSYTSFLDNPVDNVVFFDNSGNALNAWLQSGNANTATSSVVWLKLNSTGVPDLNTRTIFMGFYAKGTNHLSSSGPFGEAPTLTGTYGQYDDGGKVFNFYDNFAGSSLSGQWTTVKQEPGIKFTENNGLTITTTSTSAYGFVVGPTETAPMVAEAYTSSGDSILGVTTSTSVNNFVAPYNGYSLNWFGGAENMTYQGSGSHTTLDQIAQSVFPAGIWQVTWSATGSEFFSDGVGNNYASSDTSTTLSSYSIYLGQTSGVTASSVFQWARMRSVLPNNAMPVDFYGSVFAA